jgi:hypothetical protein
MSQAGDLSASVVALAAIGADKSVVYARVTFTISDGLLGRPVPSGLLPSWPSWAIDATTSRDALFMVPKIV